MNSGNIRITTKYFGALALFIPMGFIKGLGMGGTSVITICITVLALLLSLFAVDKMRISQKELSIWILILLLGMVIVLNTGKYMVFVSIYSLFVIRKTEKYSFINDLLPVYICTLFLLFLFSYNNSHDEMRLINGEWVNITKRSNVLFVTYFLIFNLYIIKKNKNRLIICLLILFGMILYKYTYSRSGIVCLILECFLLMVYRIRFIQKSKIIRRIVCGIPLILFTTEIVLVKLYGKYASIEYINLMLQHRIALGNKIINMYPLSLLGQKVNINTNIENYVVMDNTYLNLLINYGIVISLLWVILNIKRHV